MKRANVYLHDRLAGVLTEDESGFGFRYLDSYLDTDGAEAISLTLPLQEEEYRDTVLFPFFDGLIPEGWLLNIAENSWKINQPRPYVAIARLLQGLHWGCKHCSG